MLIDVGAESIDQGWIVRRDVQQPSRTQCIVRQQTARELVVVFVDVGLLRIRDRFRFQIGPFHQPYRGAERYERLDVLLRAI